MLVDPDLLDNYVDIEVEVVRMLEGDPLYSLRSNLQDPNNVLQSWDPTVGNPCTWFHVTCNSENSVIRVDLGNAALSGELVPELGQLKNLQYLKLFSNNITGQIPSALGNLTNLVSLDLYLNSFTGPIPDSFGKLTKLLFLRLNNNSLSGSIPMSLTNIISLEVLDLSNNRLSGPVPDNGSFSLVTPISFANNLDLCGPVTGKPCPGSPLFVPPPPFVPPAKVSSSPGENSPTAAIAGGVAAGAALLFGALAVGFAYWRPRKPQGCFFDAAVATNDFSETNILGIGGFGNVYKGCLADGTLVAVKRLMRHWTYRRELEFQRELELRRIAVHRNVLPLRGFCMTPTEKMLIYPYMANGSVASCLRGIVGSSLSFKLHLLITGLMAYDLARLARDDGDVLLDWLRGLVREKKLGMVVDPDLQNHCIEIEVEQLIQLALLCIQGSPLGRPKMSEVVRMLEGDGLADKWDEWQKEEAVRHDLELAPLPNINWIVHSSDNLEAFELSGPR
ncbi:hypothetical protein Patl1_27560 [Pistacia atlantica]|uniref:Uncharacterized protein n=1 Tax=Pistacia atlantica TaxID=434234 RepID=A0ACC1BCC3_9ROSI|nr:hypothetical protein Patl1_27560 [Pistacia atlantica]